MSVVVQPPSSHAPPTEPKAEGGVSLSTLIQRARSAPGEDPALLGSLINRSLMGATSLPDKDRQAALLLGMLDDESLHGLKDERGVPCRAVAVEALLTIGYPWALHLEPEDVQFFRDHTPTARVGLTLPLSQIFSALSGVNAGICLALSFAGALGLGVPLEVPLLATLMSAVPMVVGGRRWLTPARWMLGCSSVIAGALIALDAFPLQWRYPWHVQLPWVQMSLMVGPVFGLMGAFFSRSARDTRSRRNPSPPSTT